MLKKQEKSKKLYVFFIISMFQAILIRQIKESGCYCKTHLFFLFFSAYDPFNFDAVWIRILDPHWKKWIRI